MTRQEIIDNITAGFNDNDVSLRQFALATGTTYQVLLREAKKPIAGVAYNPDNINYTALADALIRKFGEDVVMPDFATLQTTHKTATSAGSIEVHEGDTITFRNFEGTFTVLMVTPTHVVFMEIDSTKPRVMNLDTFNHQGPRTANTDTATK